jgi:heme ABC exporter ATP-binding subunit CcmA
VPVERLGARVGVADMVSAPMDDVAESGLDGVDGDSGVDGVTESVVVLRGAVVVLGSFPALAGVDLTVSQSEIVLLRGPNGAGKTTLLRLCAGLLPLERGEGRVAGCDLTTQRAAVRSRVGMLGHSNGLYADLTVRENVRFWGATVGASGDEVGAALARMGLDRRLASVTVARLSAGQRRRTALACLIARRARLWLLDEPHAGLDATGRDELDETLRAAVGAGATVIVASHELERAGSLATRVVDVVGGQAIESSNSESPQPPNDPDGEHHRHPEDGR